MKTDKTTKVLLLLIALALWGLLLKPLTLPTVAQAASDPVPVNIAEVGGLTVYGSKGVPVQGTSIGHAVAVEGNGVQLFPVEVRPVR